MTQATSAAKLPVSRVAMIRDSGPVASLGWLVLAARSDRALLLTRVNSTQYYDTFFHGPWYFLLLAVLAGWVALGSRPVQRGVLVLRALLIAALIFEAVISAHLLGTSFAWVVAAVHTLAWGAALSLIADNLRNQRSVLALETAILFLFCGMLLVDFSFDWPYYFNPGDPQLLFRSFSNNVLHIRTWVHDILLPAGFMLLSVCVLIAGYQQRRLADLVRIALLVVGGTAVFVSIEPNERMLASLPFTNPKVPGLLATINFSHVVSLVVIAAALSLAPRTARTRQ